ncbi:low molecular weight phosphatase family protein [Microbispora sp. H11081]|uniref:arsenate reductase/protein-tyrosine-phosphatase family protein n=1 Tax=Microbispora sp. H11081 TaxID=2729107 RepID=UPI00147441E3|nr:low molecular weight phosphatase family protein [Microbispora sp. H11081]
MERTRAGEATAQETDADGAPEGAEEGAETFRVLFVCTGNICRSAMAERLALAALGPGSPILVGSAGTRARAGLPMAERASEVLSRLGGDPRGFSSRPLTADAVAGADLVLAASSEHRARAVALHPRAAARAFTIPEFGALAGAVPAESVLGHADPVGRARALLAEAGALRGLVRVDRPDIADPYGGSCRAYREAARRIADALAVPIRLLTDTRA